MTGTAANSGNLGRKLEIAMTKLETGCPKFTSNANLHSCPLKNNPQYELQAAPYLAIIDASCFSTLFEYVMLTAAATITTKRDD